MPNLHKDQVSISTLVIYVRYCRQTVVVEWIKEGRNSAFHWGKIIFDHVLIYFESWDLVEIGNWPLAEIRWGEFFVFRAKPKLNPNQSMQHLLPERIACYADIGIRNIRSVSIRSLIWPNRAWICTTACRYCRNTLAINPLRPPILMSDSLRRCTHGSLMRWTGSVRLSFHSYRGEVHETYRLRLLFKHVLHKVSAEWMWIEHQHGELVPWHVSAPLRVPQRRKRRENRTATAQRLP